MSEELLLTCGILHFVLFGFLFIFVFFSSLLLYLCCIADSGLVYGMWE